MLRPNTTDYSYNVNFAVLLDSGAKLFPLSIKCKKPNTTGFFDDVYFNYSIGMAYAGSSLVGLNLYATLSNVLQNLNGLNENTIPLILDISNFASKLLKRMIGEAGIIIGDGAVCELAIFGFCYTSSKFRVIHLYPDLNEQLDIRVSEQDISDDNYLLLLGDKKEEIRDLINQERKKINEKNILWWRSPKKVIERIVEEDIFNTIGGSVQTGISTLLGFQLYSYVVPVIKGSPESTMLDQNIDIFQELGVIGNCFIGIPGII